MYGANRRSAVGNSCGVSPTTNRSRVRGVDTESDAYRVALALQDRVTASDLSSPEIAAALAKAANLSPDEARRRFQTT